MLCLRLIWILTTSMLSLWILKVISYYKALWFVCWTAEHLHIPDTFGGWPAFCWLAFTRGWCKRRNKKPKIASLCINYIPRLLGFWVILSTQCTCWLVFSPPECKLWGLGSPHLSFGWHKMPGLHNFSSFGRSFRDTPLADTMIDEHHHRDGSLFLFHSFHRIVSITFT